jgi:RecB family endonuclease NucS
VSTNQLGLTVETAHLSGSSETDSTVREPMRLVVARCEVLYTGRLTARLPEAVRLLMFKADGSFLVHDDAGGFRPLNWIRSAFRPEFSA